MKKGLFFALLITVSGCQQKLDVPNLCAELGLTSRGFTGPSKRMDIMKSYGIKPLEAQRIEAHFGIKFEFDDADNTFKQSIVLINAEKRGLNDVYETYRSCESMVSVILNPEV